jgi:hypothetical protein
MERAPTSARTAGESPSAWGGSSAITAVAATEIRARRRQPPGPERAWAHGSAIAGHERATGVPGRGPDQVKEPAALSELAVAFAASRLTKSASQATKEDVAASEI